MSRIYTIGLDFPAWFFYEIKGIDKNFEFVWHEFKTLYDDFMNKDTGSFEDSRYNIQNIFGKEVWGYPLTNSRGEPTRENKWHLWVKHSVLGGYYHVVKLESVEDSYLSLLLSRLHLQAHAGSARKYQRLKAEEEENRRLKAQKDVRDFKRDIDAENASFYKRAMDNAMSGHLNPTNPTRDSIISYSGQRNRSRIVTPLTDKQGGLITPDEFFKK